MGGATHCSHGAGNGLLLPYAMRFNLPARPARFARVAQLLGEDVRGLDERQAAERAVAAVERLKRAIGIPERLRDLGVLGHEVFSHGAPGSFDDPERLFALAQRTGRLMELERVCRRRALSTARGHLRDGGKLFMNTSSSALRDPELTGPAFVEELEAQGMRPSDVVLEISERVSMQEREAYREALRQLKARGFGVAIDDMGAGYASLQSIVDLEPDYLKFDIALVRHIDRSLIKRSLLETLVELSGKIGASVIAEGIEEAAELAALREMEVPLGQGRYLAPPRAVSERAGRGR